MLVFQTPLDSLFSQSTNRISKYKIVLNFRKLLDVNEIQTCGSLDMRGVQISLMLILSDIY
jgi:hypothetical protein